MQFQISDDIKILNVLYKLNHCFYLVRDARRKGPAPFQLVCKQLTRILIYNS